MNFSIVFRTKFNYIEHWHWNIRTMSLGSWQSDATTILIKSQNIIDTHLKRQNIPDTIYIDKLTLTFFTQCSRCVCILSAHFPKKKKKQRNDNNINGNSLIKFICAYFLLWQWAPKAKKKTMWWTEKKKQQQLNNIYGERT